MSETKHTPGPWFSLHYKRNGQLCESPLAIASDAGDVVLATVNALKIVELRISEPDRLLILAAPDLLAACETIEKWWLEGEVQKHYGAPAWIFQVREALAKARGEVTP